MAQKAIQIVDKSKTDSFVPAGPQTLSPNAPRQITGPGEMVVIRSSTRTSGQSGVTSPVKRVAPMDATLNTVKLDTGQYVAKTDFDTLTPSQQAYLKKFGIDAFNTTGAGNVKLDSGEYISRTDFDALTPAQQTFIKTYGIEAFNAESGKIVAAANAAAKQAQEVAQMQAVQQAAYEASKLVKLSNGEYVTKDDFNKLNSEQQTQLMKLGVVGFNQWAKTSTSADTIRLNTGELVTKTEFDKLAPDLQQQLMTLGIDKFNQLAKTQSTVVTTVPANTTKLDNGDLVTTTEFSKLSVAEQQRLKSLGVEGYNIFINASKIAQTAAQSALYNFAQSLLPTGYYGPPQITGQTILDYLALKGNSVDAQNTVKAAGYDITTPDTKTGMSLLQIASKLATERNKVGNEIQDVLRSGKGVDGLISAIQNAGFYDDTKFNAKPAMDAGYTDVIWFDNITGKVLTTADLAQRLWNSLSEGQKTQVTDVYGADVYRGNYFSEQVKMMTQFAAKGGIMGQIVFGPLIAMETPFAKVLVDQPVSAAEWATAGATVIVAASTLGVLPVGGIPGVIAQGLVTGAVGTLTGLSIAQTAGNIKSWGDITKPENLVAITVDVIGLVGTVLSGISTYQASRQVIDTITTTRTAVKAGNAYDTMIKTLDKANAEAAKNGLVSANTNTKVQTVISESRAADEAFLNKFSNLDRVDVTQLNKFEKLSGFDGLSQAVQDLTDARINLEAAWKNVASQKNSVAKVQALTDAQIARENFFSKLNSLGEITTPRTGPIPSTVWDDIIDVTKADIQRVQKAIASEKQFMASKVNPDMTEYNELNSNLDILNKNLDSYVQTKAGGQWQGAPVAGLQGDIARAQLRIGELERALSDEMISAETQTSLQADLASAKNELARAQREIVDLPLKQADFAIPKDFNTELNDFLNNQGRYSPKYQEQLRIANESNAHVERMFYDDHGFWPSGEPRYPSNSGYTGEVSAVTPVTQSSVIAVNVPEITPTQMSLNVLLQDVINQPTAAEARLVAEVPTALAAKVPGIGTAVIPAPVVIVTPFGLASQTYAAEYIATMTPEQVTQIFGEQVKIQPVLTVTIPRVASLSGATMPQIRGAEWSSPAEVVRIAEASNVAAYVQAIMAQVTEAVNRVLLVTDDTTALKAAQEITIQTYLSTITNPALRDAVAAQIKALNTAASQTQTQTQTQTAVQTGVQTATSTATEVAQQTATETQVQPATRIKQAVKTATEVTPLVETVTDVITPIEPIIPIIPFIPVLPSSSSVGKRKLLSKKYPAGTAIWKMGFVWKIIPPPYTIVKPISTRKAPLGVKVLQGSPQETLTFIGGVLPFKDISFDLGVVDGYIDVKAQKIIFTGQGEKTKVGLSLPEPTRGITFPAVTEERARAIAAQQRDALGMSTRLRKGKMHNAVIKTKTTDMLVQLGR